MSQTPASPPLAQSLTPKLRSAVIDRTERLLLRIVRANLNTQYASKAGSLSGFRDAISAHGTASDTELLDDFRRCVPLSDYDSYKPLVAAFDKHPCKETDLENLFAPGIPDFIAVSSATSGNKPKLFPRYYASFRPVDFNTGKPAAKIFFHGYREIKEVERDPGQIVKKIPVCIASAGMVRAAGGWTNIDEDDSRMSLIAPGEVAPIAAGMVKPHKSFLMIHALFALAFRDLDHIALVFSNIFFDLVHFVDKDWDMFVSSIRDGTVPDLPGVDEVRSHLQAHFHANPERATELREIGPPFSCEGWAARVWPKLRMLVTVCSGQFAAVLPKVKLVLGPTIAICSPGYGSSESFIAPAYRPTDPNTFVLRSPDVVEFSVVTAVESHETLCQAWELEVGKQYKIVLTTTDGLWRYRLDDVIDVVGFDPDTGSPVFTYVGRGSLTLRFFRASIADTHLMSAMRAVSSDVIEVREFTTALDDRQSPLTVGYFVELAGTLGPNAHLAGQRLFEGLLGTNVGLEAGLKEGRFRLPTVRIVTPGTFAAYRQWKADRMEVGTGQVKLPVVLLDAASKEWVLERVTGEV